MSIDLDKWRADPARWIAVVYTEVKNEHGLSDDANREARATVLDLLLRDRRDSDVELLRYLLVQEIRMHAASWGIADSLRLATLLLSECGRAEDVWLLWEAKCTNFDTYTGLDGALLYPAGVVGTLAYIRTAEHTDREKLLEYLTEYLVHESTSEQELHDRLAGFRDYHRG